MLFFGYLNQTLHLCCCLLFDVAKIRTFANNANFKRKIFAVLAIINNFANLKSIFANMEVFERIKEIRKTFFNDSNLEFANFMGEKPLLLVVGLVEKRNW